MKKLKLSYGIFVLMLLIGSQGYSQFSGWKEKILQTGAALGAKKMGLDQVLKKPEAITTSFEDVDQTGSKLPD